MVSRGGYGGGGYGGKSRWASSSGSYGGGRSDSYGGGRSHGGRGGSSYGGNGRGASSYSDRSDNSYSHSGYGGQKPSFDRGEEGKVWSHDSVMTSGGRNGSFGTKPSWGDGGSYGNASGRSRSRSPTGW